MKYKMQDFLNKKNDNGTIEEIINDQEGILDYETFYYNIYTLLRFMHYHYVQKKFDELIEPLNILNNIINLTSDTENEPEGYYYIGMISGIQLSYQQLLQNQLSTGDRNLNEDTKKTITKLYDYYNQKRISDLELSLRVLDNQISELRANLDDFDSYYNCGLLSGIQMTYDLLFQDELSFNITYINNDGKNTSIEFNNINEFSRIISLTDEQILEIGIILPNEEDIIIEANICGNSIPCKTFGELLDYMGENFLM